MLVERQFMLSPRTCIHEQLPVSRVGVEDEAVDLGVRCWAEVVVDAVVLEDVRSQLIEDVLPVCVGWRCAAGC